MKTKSENIDNIQEKLWGKGPNYVPDDYDSDLAVLSYKIKQRVYEIGEVDDILANYMKELRKGITALKSDIKEFIDVALPPSIENLESHNDMYSDVINDAIIKLGNSYHLHFDSYYEK